MERKKLIILLGLGVLVVALIVLAIILMVNNSHKLTELEKIKITEKSDEVSNYFEYVEGKKEIDKYIIFALEYSYNELNAKTVKLDKVKEIIDENFTIGLTTEEIEDFGISPDMVDKNIIYDFNNKEFTINVNKLSYGEIAKLPVIKYNPIKYRKSKNTYKVTYTKYVVENPYEILNYYNDLQDEKIDTTEITNYLKGKEKISTIRKYINEKNIDKVGKKENNIVVTYVVKEDKIIIKDIKEQKK